MLEAFAQVRQRLVQLCDQQRHSTARLFLVGSGCGPGSHTALWEYVARRSEETGNAVVARNLRREIREAGAGSSDLALREADRLLESGDYEGAEYLIETAFGAGTTDHEARRRLAQSYFRQSELSSKGERLRTDKGRALELAKEFSFDAPKDAMVLIDLLRFSGELALALERTHTAKGRFPNDIRFATREARILEQMNDLGAAADIWEDILNRDERLRGEALLKLCSLYERLERVNELSRTQALLALSDVSISERLRLALATGQARMAHALAEYLGMGGPIAEKLTAADTRSFVEQLLDNGEIGLAVWLRRKRVPVGDRVKWVLDSMGFTVGGAQALPDTVAEAVDIRSPDFMLPLENTLGLQPKPKGWPGTGKMPRRILLVNSALGIGGAERQFVQLVRSLIQSGIDKGKIDVGIFSLAQDRGHAHFLSELLELGVAIHDLGDRAYAGRTLPPKVGRMIEALPLTYRADARALWHLVADIDPDVLHGWQDRSAALCGLIGVAASVKRIVISLRNMSPATRRDKSLLINKALFRDLVRRDNVMVSTNSHLAATDYAAWLNCDPGRINAIPNAMDVSILPALKDDGKVGPGVTGSVRIGGVFRLAVNKRPLLWLRTVRRLQEISSIEVIPVLYGSGPLSREVEEEAKALGLGNLVIKSGITDPAEIHSNLDVLLLMSQVEGLPNVLLEAQAMGKPVIACDVGGVREAVKLNGKGAGLILPADVTPEVAARQIDRWLISALSAPPYLLRRHIEGQFAPALLAERTLRAYRGEREDRT